MKVLLFLDKFHANQRGLLETDSFLGNSGPCVQTELPCLGRGAAPVTSVTALYATRHVAGQVLEKADRGLMITMFNDLNV